MQRRLLNSAPKTVPDMWQGLTLWRAALTACTLISCATFFRKKTLTALHTTAHCCMSRSARLHGARFPIIAPSLCSSPTRVAVTADQECKRRNYTCRRSRVVWQHPWRTSIIREDLSSIELQNHVQLIRQLVCTSQNDFLQRPVLNDPLILQ